LGLFDNLSNSITLVEWPQIIKEKPKNLIEFDFKYENDHQQRYVQIKGLNL
jgi:tRNA threonylcarbamoyladenosine biosynthesis protein TsaE